MANKCACGCGRPVTKGKLFVSGHDRAAAAMLIRLLHGTVAGFLADSGYGPGGKNLRTEFDHWTKRQEAVRGWDALQALAALERRREALEAELIRKGALAPEGSTKDG